MKILTVVINLEKGGTQRAAQSFAEGYASLGHDSRILALYGLGPRYDEISGNIPVFKGLNSKNSKSVVVWNPDIVHIHSNGPKNTDIKKLIGLCPRAKIIETNVFSKPSPWANSVDVSFQLSDWAQWLFNMRGGNELNSEIVPNPIKCDAFKKASIKDIVAFKKNHSIPEDAFVIGRIGQSLKGKWSLELLKVFNKVSRKIPKAYLLLVNPPGNILEAANKSPYKEKIVHIEKIFGDDNLSIAYSAMDVMLLIVEQGESFGIVSTESILCETPVITLNTPWGDNSQGEVIGNYKGGYVVNRKKNLPKILFNLYEGSIKYSPFAGIEHVHKYNYIQVAEKALHYTFLTNKKPQMNNTSTILANLKNGIDQPHFLTLLFLSTNSNFFRLLTIYSTGYKGVLKMLKSGCNFLIRKILKK